MVAAGTIMAKCTHVNATRCGFTIGGKQRWRCKDCGVTFVDLDRIAGNNRLPREKEEFVLSLISEGHSIRRIRAASAARFGKPISPWAIQRRMPKATPPIDDKKKVGRKGHCDFCGKRIKGQREFNRRTRRTRHKFCTQLCYQAFWREVRGKRRCKRCGVKRQDIPIATKEIINGMCPPCYARSRMKVARKAAVAVQLHRLQGALEAACPS